MYGFVITDAGRGLLARSSAGQPLALTGVEVGSGAVESLEEARALTALVERRAAGTSSAPRTAGSQVSLLCEYRNDLNGGLVQGFTLTELGVFARVGDESPVLFLYACFSDAPQTVLPIAQGLDVHRFPVAWAVADGTPVTLEYPDGAFLTAGELEAMKGRPGGLAGLGEDGKVPAQQLPEMDYDPAGSAEEVQEKLTEHISDKSNPHGVTAEQVGVSKNVADLMGIPEGSSVDDAFIATLLVSKQLAMVKVAVTVAGAPAVADIEVTGLEGLDGGTVYTDANGMAVGFAPAGEVSISTPTYQDLPAAPAVTRELAAGEIVDVSLAIGSAPQAGDKSITSATSGIRFSPYVTGVDVHCINGGFSGGAGSGSYASDGTFSCRGGEGGRSGAQKYQKGIKPDYTIPYDAVIGAGGVPAKGNTAWENPNDHSDGNNPGGITSFMGISPPLYGGTAGGAGAYYTVGSDDKYSANATPGIDDITHVYGESDQPIYGGSGGGGGAGSAYGDKSRAAGGSPGGGAGGYATRNTVPSAASAGTVYGAGGGGAGCSQNSTNFSTNQSGAGYQGAIFYRWRVS